MRNTYVKTTTPHLFHIRELPASRQLPWKRVPPSPLFWARTRKATRDLVAEFSAAWAHDENMFTGSATVRHVCVGMIYVDTNTHTFPVHSHRARGRENNMLQAARNNKCRLLSRNWSKENDDKDEWLWGSVSFCCRRLMHLKSCYLWTIHPVTPNVESQKSMHIDAGARARARTHTYRGTALLSLIWKVCSRVMESMIRPVEEPRIKEVQCGFHPGGPELGWRC